MRRIISEKGIGYFIRFVIGIFILMSILGRITAQEYNSLPDSLDCFTPKSTLEEISIFVEQAEVKEMASVANLTAVCGGVTINVNAVAGILPEGTQIAVKLLSDEEKKIYIKSLKKNNSIIMSQYLLYDITLYDKQGREIQPDGEVTVSFSGLQFENNNTGLVVLHAEESVKGKDGIFFSKKYPETNIQEISELTQYASVNPAEIHFRTAHFSVYLVGTTNTATYNFMVGSTLMQTQIVLNGESLLEPETPTSVAGQRFTGWYVQGETSPLVFNQAVTVPSTTTLTVNANFEDVWYVYFVYNNEVITTKEVSPGGTTDGTNVPILITEEGEAFSHWSTSVDGPAFNFSSQINANTTLYAVSTAQWQVAFNTQGGSTLLPLYVVDGQPSTLPATPPVRVGYTFSHWSATVGGSAFNFATPITSNTILYAVWTSKTVNYNVVYWQQNAEDDEYTYYETKTRTGQTGADATYATLTYTGFTLNTTKTDATANNAVIKGDGTTVKNVYYDRNVWTFKIEYKSNNSWYTFSTTPVKYGQSTAPWYNAAVTAHFGYRWLTSRGSSTSYSEAPDMPNKNLTVSGEYSGNTAFTIRYYEYNTTTSIHNNFIFYASGSTSFNFTIEDAIGIEGYTATDISTWEPLESGTPARQGTIYYTRISYTITFATNDGNTPQVSDPIPYENSIAGQALAGYTEDVTTYIKNGVTLTFGGWFTSPVFAEDSKFNFSGKTMPANNITLYAKWNYPAHILVYHNVMEPSGATGNAIYLSIDYGGTINEDDLVYVIPEGMQQSDFIGWYWFVNGVFIAFDFNMPVYSTLELFPVWAVQTYTVCYNLNGGSGTIPVDPVDYYSGALAVVLPISGIAPPANKVFVGWENDNIIYYPNNDLTITGNMTLTAQWGDLPQKTQLTYNANGGTGDDIVITNLINNETHTLQNNTFTNTGKTFAGWNTNTDGSGVYYGEGSQIIVGAKEVPDNNILYAQWVDISLIKSGVFNDENGNGKAEIGETIFYTFEVTNTSTLNITLNNITISDPKITVNGGPITLAAGATSIDDFVGTYTLTQGDINAGQVDNTATVTGYTPILSIPVSDSDSETVEFAICSLEITCPTTWDASYSCSNEVPDAFAVNSLASTAGFGITDACGIVRIYSVVEAITNQTCISRYTLTRTYIVYDDLNNNSQYDSGEEISDGCDQVITVNDNIVPAITCPEPISSSPSIGQTSMSISVGNATATDNCTEDANITIVGSRSDALNIGDPYPLGLTTITWTATDEAGNQTSCNQEVNIVSSCVPGGVSNGLELWLRSNSGVYHNGTAAGNDEWVSLWDDQIKNRDAISTESYAPVFSDVSSQLINYNPVLVFDGSNDYLTSPLNSSEMTDNLTLFVVAKPSAYGSIVGIGNSTSLAFVNENAISFRINNASASSTTTTSNKYVLNSISIISVVKTGNVSGEVSIFLNGLESEYAQTNNAAITNGADTYIGSGVYSVNPDYFTGPIAEVIIYNRSLSDSERVRVESYLAVKYGITLGD